MGYTAQMIGIVVCAQPIPDCPFAIACGCCADAMHFYHTSAGSGTACAATVPAAAAKQRQQPSASQPAAPTATNFGPYFRP